MTFPKPSRTPQVSGQQPSILQLHDWHAAAAALLYWECYHHSGLYKPRVMLTIHNFDNSGECRQDDPPALIPPNP